MKTVLVTGGAGFIGSHLIDGLLSKGEKVICIDDFNDYYSPERKRKNIEHNLNNKNFNLIDGDITHKETLDELFEKNKRIDTLNNYESRKYNAEDFIYSFSDLINVNFKGFDETRSIFSPKFKARKRVIKKDLNYDTWQ